MYPSKASSMRSFMRECEALTESTFTSRNLLITPTSSTPLVKYTSFKSETIIEGDSTMEEAEEFFRPVIFRIKDDLRELQSTNITFALTSFGPKTAKVLFQLFGYLRNEVSKGKSINITWNGAKLSKEMMEVGASFSELFNLNFNQTKGFRVI